jgi:phage baseplate assembly protein gpV
MSSVLPLLQAIAVHGAAPARGIELAIVTQVYTDEAGNAETNPAVNARLRGSGVELQRVPVMVGRIGVSAVPRVGDLIVVAFVGGELDAAVVLGSLYDEQNRPPAGGPDEVVYKVPDAEASDVRRLAVELPNGDTLTLQDDTLTIDMSGTTVTVSSGGNVSIRSKADLEVKADGNITLEAQGDIELKAAGNLTAEATGNAKLKASAAVAVEGAATAKLKGASTTIAGTTMFSAG